MVRREKSLVLLAIKDQEIQKKLCLMIEGMRYKAHSFENVDQAAVSVRCLPAGRFYTAILFSAESVLEAFPGTLEEIRQVKQKKKNCLLACFYEQADSVLRIKQQYPSYFDLFLKEPIEKSDLVNAFTQFNCDKPSIEVVVKEEENPILDLERMASLKELDSDGSQNIVSELAQIFFDSSDYALKLLKEAVDEQNAPKIRNFAHKLKGTASNMGAKKLSAICQNLEHNSSLNQIDDSQVILDDIIAAHHEVSQVLRKDWLKSV